jgi:GNAT superfamily N-acetyltransferase
MSEIENSPRAGTRVAFIHGLWLEFRRPPAVPGCARLGGGRRLRDRVDREAGGDPARDVSSIRLCRGDERAVVLAIVNAAAEVYRGVIPQDRWREPYMDLQQLESEIAAGVVFWGYEADGVLIGVMGIQAMEDVDLIRHAYVLPGSQRLGVGGALLSHVGGLTARRVLVGTWAAADWAIRFYQRNGFELSPRRRRTRCSRSTGASLTARSRRRWSWPGLRSPRSRRRVRPS